MKCKFSASELVLLLLLYIANYMGNMLEKGYREPLQLHSTYVASQPLIIVLKMLSRVEGYMVIDASICTR